MIFSELPLGSQECKKLSTGDVVHQEVQIAMILRESLQADLFESFVTTLIKDKYSYQEGMINVSKDSVLRNHVIHLLQLNNVRLLQDLHRKIFSCLFISGKTHSAERTYMNSLSTNGNTCPQCCCKVIVMETDFLFRCH